MFKDNKEHIFLKTIPIVVILLRYLKVLNYQEILCLKKNYLNLAFLIHPKQLK